MIKIVVSACHTVKFRTQKDSTCVKSEKSETEKIDTHGDMVTVYFGVEKDQKNKVFVFVGFLSTPHWFYL
jgi:hypothetical protein